MRPGEHEGKEVAAFKSVREAKDFLAGKIVEEAKKEGVALSEIEQKMLYFSETDWTLSGMLEINAEFERDYSDSEYERKIAGISATSKRAMPATNRKRRLGTKRSTS
jgi:hypothetical protein